MYCLHAQLLDQRILHFLSPSGEPTQVGTTPRVVFPTAVGLKEEEVTEIVL